MHAFREGRFETVAEVLLQSIELRGRRVKKKKIKYELRYFIDDNISARFATYTDKEEAIGVAKFQSKHEEDRIYFVKMITEQVIFFVGEWG